MAETFDTRKGQNVDIRFNIYEKFAMVVTVTDQDDVAEDLSAKVLVFSIREKENSTAVETMTTAAGEIVVSGVGNNVLTFSKTLDVSQKNYFYDLYNDTDDKNIMDGRFYADYTGR